MTAFWVAVPDARPNVPVRDAVPRIAARQLLAQRLADHGRLETALVLLREGAQRRHRNRLSLHGLKITFNMAFHGGRILLCSFFILVKPPEKYGA